MLSHYFQVLITLKHSEYAQDSTNNYKTTHNCAKNSDLLWVLFERQIIILQGLSVKTVKYRHENRSRPYLKCIFVKLEWKRFTDFVTNIFRCVGKSKCATETNKLVENMQRIAVWDRRETATTLPSYAQFKERVKTIKMYYSSLFVCFGWGRYTVRSFILSRSVIGKRSIWPQRDDAAERRKYERKAIFAITKFCSAESDTYRVSHTAYKR